MQLARHAGAEIFATAGSSQKRDYLRSLGVEHVFDSRSLNFRAQIDHATEGQGVDLVLNSLAGDSIEASFAALATRGRFVEIGKNQIWSPEKVASLDRHIEYFIVDLADQIDSDQPLIHAHFSKLRHLFESGELEPLPARVFRFEDAPAAFRHMAQAKHMGRLVLLHAADFKIRPDATYLITGGLGAIRLQSAEWLAERGARHLVLTGRSAPGRHASEIIDALRNRGLRVEVRACDVARRTEIADVLDESARNMPPLAGILHTAGILDDGIFLEQNWARMEKVLAPKVTGAWNLHELCSGNHSISSYCSPRSHPLPVRRANRDIPPPTRSWTNWRTRQARRGLPALSVNWGAWAGTGMAAQVEESGRRRVLPGIRAMSPQNCFAALENALAQNVAQVAIVDAD